MDTIPESRRDRDLPHLIPLRKRNEEDFLNDKKSPFDSMNGMLKNGEPKYTVLIDEDGKFVALIDERENVIPVKQMTLSEMDEKGREDRQPPMKAMEKEIKNSLEKMGGIMGFYHEDDGDNDDDEEDNLCSNLCHSDDDEIFFTKNSIENAALSDDDDEDDSTIDYDYVGEMIDHDMCVRCGVKGSTEMCTGCKCVAYCSSKCQKDDWEDYHRQECGTLLAAAAAAASKEIKSRIAEKEEEEEGNLTSDDDYEDYSDEKEDWSSSFVADTMINSNGPRRRGRRTARTRTRTMRRSRSVPFRRSRPLRTRTGRSRRRRLLRRGRRGARRFGRRGRTVPLRRIRRRRGFGFRGRRFGRLGGGFRRFRRRFRGRRWFRPSLYSYFALWYPSFYYPLSSLGSDFIRGLPILPPFDVSLSPWVISRQLRRLRFIYRRWIDMGFQIVPDYDSGRFIWIATTLNPRRSLF